MRDSGAISVTAVAGKGRRRRAQDGRDGRAAADELAWREYALSGLRNRHHRCWPGMVLRAVSNQALASIGMLFLVPVMMSAVSFGLRAALVRGFLQPVGL